MCQTEKISIEQNGARRDSNESPKQQHNTAIGKNVLDMDEAITKTKFGLFNYVLIFVSGVSLFAVISEAGSIPYILPVSECDLNLTASQKGILSGIQFVGMICSSHLWGFLADTKGRRRVIQPTLLIAFLMSVASSFAENFYLFTTLRFLNGFFISGCSATIFAYLSEFHDKVHRARAIMVASIIYGALCILEPLFAWIVINNDWQFNVPLINITYKPWRLFLVVNGIPALTAFIILIFLPESPKFVLVQGKHDNAYKILEKMNRVNNGKSSKLEKFEIKQEAESTGNLQQLQNGENSISAIVSVVWNQTAALFKPPHLFPTLLICFIQFCAFFPTGCSMFSPLILNRMATNLNDYLHDRAKMCDVINMKQTQQNQTADVALNDKVCNSHLELEMLKQMIMMEAAFTLCFLLVGVLINKVGKYPILLVTFIGMGASGISTMLHSIPILQISGYLTLLLCGVGANVVSSATVEVYPTALRGMAVCISLMFARLGGVVGANVVALLMEHHCEMVFYIPGTLLIIAGTLTYFIPKIHEKADNTKRISTVSRSSVYSLNM